MAPLLILSKAMNEESEQEIKRAICDLLSLFPTRCTFTVNHTGVRGYKSKYLRVGWPDISGMWDNRGLFIEVKKPGGVVSSEQKLILSQLKRFHGAYAFVAYSVEDVEKVLL
jgi:hypothetical protein